MAPRTKKTKAPPITEDSASEPPPGWLDIEIPVAAQRALARARYVSEAQRAAIAAGAVHDDGEYMTIRITAIDAQHLAADITHAIVHGRLSVTSAEVLEEIALALESGLGIP